VPLACPICHRAFGAFSRTSKLSCVSCTRTFPSVPLLDLTLAGPSGAGGAFKESRPQSTSLFQQPLISFVYERGWRQSFAWAGFPGEQAEYEQAQAWLAPAAGGVLLDMSCGSGLFTRRFAASGAYAQVVGADFSEAMLQEAQSLESQGQAASTPVTLLRADVARLPFATGSLDAVHAGAALHCWPSPSAAMAEISRVLRPGGLFVASTFLDPTGPLGELLGDAFVLPLAQAIGAQRTSSYRWWNEAELRDLCAMVGLTDFQRIRTRQFILLRVSKPAS